MRCEHEHDDGAYVLGALAPAERAEYERHLSTCSFCREAVAEIAVLPGLLGRLDPADFADLDVPPARPRVPDLVDAARVDRRRQGRSQRWRYAGTALVAACLALVIGVGLAGRWDGDARGAVQMVAMQPVTAGAVLPISAEIGLRRTSYGTELTMRCAYTASATHTRAYIYRLVAYGPDEQKEQVNSWVAAPGEELTLAGTTRFSGIDLVRVEVQRFDGTPVLVLDVR
ncbi:MAG TPA: zf-HC2 domain-containing protein [Catenuloplanes sp.]